MDELIPITINIADRNYRIKVEPEHEESVRKTAKLIQEKVYEFKQNFSGKDMQDYIAMALIWFGTQNAQQVHGQLLANDLSEGFSRIDQLLDKGLAAIESRG